MKETLLLGEKCIAIPKRGDQNQRKGRNPLIWINEEIRVKSNKKYSRRIKHAIVT